MHFADVVVTLFCLFIHYQEARLIYLRIKRIHINAKDDLEPFCMERETTP